MIASLDRFSRQMRAGGLFVLLLAIAGCGYAEYEVRLNESKKYYAYLDRIEQSLAPKWLVAGNLMDLRVPRQFTLIPPPAPIQNEEGKTEEPVIDPRQPNYLNLKLPELYGAWESKFTVARPDGTSEDRQGYIYVVCNYWYLSGERASDAGNFVDELKSLMKQSLNVEPTDERAEMQPTGIPVYQQQFPYDVCSFKGVDIDGAKYTFDLYSRTNGSVIAAIVIVLPEAMDSPQKVSERIPMMLGSFHFTKDPPRAGADKSAPAQPAAAPSGF